MKNKIIGLLGGSFNPIQNDHIRIALETIEKKLVDEVWLVPAKLHPFEKNLISPNLRLNMIKLAIKSYPKIKLCDIELNEETSQKSFTTQTLKRLKNENPSLKFIFIIGSDNLSSIEKWNDFEYLKDNIEFIIHERKGYKIPEKLSIIVTSIIKDNISDISSSLVRTNISQGKSIKNLVSPQVEEYMRLEGLYQNGK